MNLARLLGVLFTYGVVGPRPSAATVDVIAGIVDLEKETIGYSKKWDSDAPFRISLTFLRRVKKESIIFRRLCKNWSEEKIKGI